MKRVYGNEKWCLAQGADGAMQACGVYTARIREQTPLDTLNFEPALMAFSEEKRGKLLGGIV